jgi:exodeoxyribonuclease-5
MALDTDGAPDVVIDWKSDVAPDAAVINLYREQVREYLAATGATQALLVFVSTGRIERVGLD